MRTNIVIDDALMKNALKATGLKTKKEAVELGLQTLIQLNRQADIRKLRGKLTVPAAADRAAIEAAARASAEVAKHANGAPVKKVVVVPGRLVNVVV